MIRKFQKKLLQVEKELKKIGLNDKTINQAIIRLENDYPLIKNEELMENYFRLLNTKIEFIKKEFVERRKKRNNELERITYWRHKADFEKERIKQLSNYEGLTQTLHQIIEESLNL